MQKIILILAAVLGALSVIIGAFGAHAFKELLETHQRMETFETGVKYQFYHILAMLGVGLLMFKIEDQWLNYSAYSFLAGIVLFSGSLYILSLTGITKWGAVTPLGGLFLILGWVFLIVSLSRNL